MTERILDQIYEQERKLWQAAKERDAFHVTTTWKKTEDSWKVVFNMDQRIVA